MVKLGAYDLTNNVEYSGITDGVEVVTNGQSYTAPSGVQVENIKGGHYSYQLKLQYVTDSVKSGLDSLNNSDSFTCKINGDNFLGYIQSISATYDSKYWSMTITVMDISLS